MKNESHNQFWRVDLESSIGGSTSMEGSKAEEGNQTMKLYSHWMSSCSRRVRLALHLKGLKYDCINITSVGDPELLKVNPMGYVPALVDDTTVISDSYAILLVASIVSSSIQPLQNTSLVNYIGEIVSPDEKIPWAQYHIRKGFVALEKLLTNYAGKYATGDEVYLADLYLAPQLDNAINRYKLDMTEFPLLSKLNKAYSELPSFQQMLAETQNLDADKIFGLVKKLAA
ncbi:Glutathione S-transferase/chloride channel, C-terminal [Cynara cardunculus var. scolymus]|uniref:Glutathione S-transferase/chloride channel, C-terminal n=1 Tax=Cynara cardunculus var. scolymus TaxID=59895 RepID=A0A103YGA7_CYNCS|nr:Glutathione S-transferase/chloride channel, C-terminal [Cynara cardunculus var. scolymus]